MSLFSDWMSGLPIPHASQVQPTSAEPHFPRVTGINLERATLHLPHDFAGELNLLLFAFQRWQQPLVNRWLPLARALEARYSGLCYYEIPTLGAYSAPQRLWINEGMRAGIPDPIARERTVSLYLHDRSVFMRTLGLGSDLTIYTLLVTRAGEIVWRTSGDIDEQKRERLQHLLRESVSNEGLRLERTHP